MSTTTASNAILTNSINAITANTGDISIGASQTTGALNIGCKGDETLSGRTTGVINIGSDLSATGQIRIGNNAAITPLICRGSFNCNRFAQFDTSLTVNSTLTGVGNTTLAPFIGSGANINILSAGSTLSGSVINMYSGATSAGTVNIATGTGATQSTVVNIGSGSTTGTVTIGNSANTTNLNSTTVNVSRNTTNTTNTFVEVVSGSSSNNVRFHSSGTNNVTSDARITVSGGSSATDAGTMAIVAGNLQIFAPMSIQAGKNITLQPTAGIVAPTAFTQLGGTSTTTSSITLSVIGAFVVIIPVQITRAGTYLFTIGSQVTHTGSLTFFYSNIFESSASQTVNDEPVAGTGVGVITNGNFGRQALGTLGTTPTSAVNGSFVYTVPEAKANFYYSLVLACSGGGTLGNLNSFMTITRLA
jgi:hypothetical protein